MNDLKNIKKLKSLCAFSYEIVDGFCESISFYDKKNIFENTIRKSNFKKEIISIICTFPNLKYVNLRKSRIDKFPKFLSKNLEYLDLSCNDIVKVEENDIKFFKLKYLNLGSNNIKELPDLAHCPLEILKLHKNPLKKLPNTKKSIKNLNLFFNYNLKKIPIHLFELLDLEIFSFGVTPIKEFPSLSIFKKLKWLNLSCNQFEIVDDSICDCKNLEGIILAKNNIKKIPKDIGSLQKLKILSLYKNNLKKLPDSFYDLNLTNLSLEYNPIRKKNFIKKFFKNIESFNI